MPHTGNIVATLVAALSLALIVGLLLLGVYVAASWGADARVLVFHPFPLLLISISLPFGSAVAIGIVRPIPLLRGWSDCQSRSCYCPFGRAAASWRLHQLALCKLDCYL